MCECAERIEALEQRIAALENPPQRSAESTISASTQLASRPFGFANVRQRPIEVKA